ncbi:TOBE domain-containing protein [Pseudomonas purpurea]|uniref:TOBE domain-containing protein n=1 Tax=Pseudomonas purpurea TaxID=3136737 RepID=UPI003263A9A4
MSLPTLLSQHIVRRPQRIALLQHIAEQGSITRAAKSAGLSYKAAWDAIDELNNLAQKPLVERSVGGKGGGGAKLSAEGERVLRLYQRLQALQAQVLEAAEDASDLDLDLLGRLMLRTSARNQLHGKVATIDTQGRNDLISLELAEGLILQAQITHDSTRRLELETGTEVVALIKAGWLELLAADQSATPGHNCLKGIIEEILDAEDGPSEVRIALPNGQTLCALAEPLHLKTLGLSAEKAVQVQFSPSNVLLGTPL